MPEHTPHFHYGDSRPTPYIPPNHFFLPEFRIQQPRTISLAPGWLFDATDYARLRMGHEAQGESDDWTCYMSTSNASDTPAGDFHAHQATTDHEIFRMPLSGDGVIYLARDFTTEQDPARHGFADDEAAKNALADLFEHVMRAPPIRFE